MFQSNLQTQNYQSSQKYCFYYYYNHFLRKMYLHITQAFNVGFPFLDYPLKYVLVLLSKSTLESIITLLQTKPFSCVATGSYLCGSTFLQAAHFRRIRSQDAFHIVCCSVSGLVFRTRRLFGATGPIRYPLASQVLRNLSRYD